MPLPLGDTQQAPLKLLDRPTNPPSSSFHDTFVQPAYHSYHMSTAQPTVPSFADFIHCQSRRVPAVERLQVTLGDSISTALLQESTLRHASPGDATHLESPSYPIRARGGTKTPFPFEFGGCIIGGRKVPIATQDQSKPPARPAGTTPSQQLRRIYICSSGHSGSTLLEMLLAGHSDMVAVGEILNLHHQLQIERVCSCGRLPKECPTWQAVNEIVSARRGFSIFEFPKRFRTSRERPQSSFEHLVRTWNRICYYAHFRHPLLGLNPLDRLVIGGRQMRENDELVAETFRDLWKAPIVVDSSKDYVRMREVYNSPHSGRVKVIYLCRDGRGCVWSSVKRKNGSTAKNATEWAVNQKRTRNMLSGVAREDWLLVRYEDLCGDVETTIKKLCCFLGVDYEPAMLDLQPAQHHTIAGNQIRTQRGMQVRLDEGWKEGLSTEDLRIFARIAGKENRRLGYPS